MPNPSALKASAWQTLTRPAVASAKTERRRQHRNSPPVYPGCCFP